MSAHRLLDLCCCAGLIADGYSAVGFEVHGVDVEPQPDYPYSFTQGDAIEVLAGDLPEQYDAVHTSFPCQWATRGKHLRQAQGGTCSVVDLLTPGLELLRTRWSHKPWIAENVEDPETYRVMQPRPGEHLIRLCGSTFGLQVQRHRLFLANFPLRQPTRDVRKPDSARMYGCRHELFPPDDRTGKPRPWGVWHVPGDSVPDGGRTARDAEHGRQVMGSHRLLPWSRLKEGVPPAYGSHVGADLLVHLALQRAQTDRAVA